MRSIDPDIRVQPLPALTVNGEHPEAVAQAIRLAMEYREKFRKDVVVDMVCVFHGASIVRVGRSF